jgi:hypothetical protein
MENLKLRKGEVIVKNTSAILKILYPIVDGKMNTHASKFKQCVSRFVDKRNKELFDTGPYDRIPYGSIDSDDLHASVDVKREEVKRAISETYYWAMPAFNPRYAEDETTILLLTIIRYYIMKKNIKDAEVAALYLAFSGKFYPSIHYAMFPVAEPSKYRQIMEFVMNNLSQSFEFKKSKTLINTMKSVCDRWVESYDKLFKEFSDEDVAYLLQQLHNRIKSVIKNIAKEYYKAYENKDYITYNSENVREDDFHLADSDALQAERFIDKAITKIQHNTIEYKYCKMASSSLVKAEEIKQILESIVNEKTNIGDIKILIRNMVYTYCASPDTSNQVSDIRFLTFTIAPKPNTSNKHFIKIEEIVENWLDTYSKDYVKRKKREATKNAYKKSIKFYFALVIHTANK